MSIIRHRVDCDDVELDNNVENLVNESLLMMNVYKQIKLGLSSPRCRGVKTFANMIPWLVITALLPPPAPFS